MLPREVLRDLHRVVSSFPGDHDLLPTASADRSIFFRPVHGRVRVVGRTRRGGRRRARHHPLHVLQRVLEVRLRQLVLREEALGDGLCGLAAAPTDLLRAFPRDVNRSEEVGVARRGRRRGRLNSVFRSSTRNSFTLSFRDIIPSYRLCRAHFKQFQNYIFRNVLKLFELLDMSVHRPGGSDRQHRNGLFCHPGRFAPISEDRVSTFSTR